MSSMFDSNDTKVSQTDNDDDTRPSHPEVDIIWHNMYTPSTFVSLRKHSSRTIEQLLFDFTRLVDRGVFSVISLSVSKASFVAVVGCEREWEDVEKEVMEATR